MEQLTDDVIVAIATPAGRSAVALIRMSGHGSFAVARRVAQSWRGRDRVSELVTIRHPGSGQTIDRGLVTAFIAPRSYTGEDLVELTVHGGAIVPVLVSAALVAAGARRALPGEFTRRAVLQGKLDILQAEGIADLVDARTRGAHQIALRQADGLLSSRLTSLRDAVLNIEALVAYDVDFPEEDNGPLAEKCVEAAVGRVLDDLSCLLAHASRGEISRRGATTVIAGPSNVGKSTLFNALIGQARALVSNLPGTTRDALEAEIELAEVPLRLIDTAGRRDTADHVEQLGIELTDRWISAADIVLACGDERVNAGVVAAELSQLTAGAVIPVQLKADLVLSGVLSSNRIVADGEYCPSDQAAPLLASAHTGYGLDALIDRIVAVVRDRIGSIDPDAPLLTRERHRVGIAAALREIRRFQELRRDDQIPAVIAAVHLRAAAAAMEEIVGVVAPDDVLSRVFESFCIGK